MTAGDGVAQLRCNMELGDIDPSSFENSRAVREAINPRSVSSPFCQTRLRDLSVEEGEIDGRDHRSRGARGRGRAGHNC